MTNSRYGKVAPLNGKRLAKKAVHLSTTLSGRYTKPPCNINPETDSGVCDARFIDKVEPNDDPKRTTGEFTFVLMKSLMKSV